MGTGQNEGRLSDLDSTGPNYRALCPQTYTILQDKGRMNPMVIQRPSGLPPWFQRGQGTALTSVGRMAAAQGLGGVTPTRQSHAGGTDAPPRL